MKEWIKWIANGFETVKVNTIETGRQLAELGRKLYSSPTAREVTINAVEETSQGYWRFIPLNANKLLRRPNTLKSLFFGMSADLLFMTQVILYDKTMQLGAQSIPGMKDSYVETTIDQWVYLYFSLRSYAVMFDALFYKAAINKGSTNEEGENPHFKACGCDNGPLIKADLASIFYYLSNTFAIKVVGDYVPLVGPLLRFLLTGLLYGQCLVEYRLSAAGMCTEHRYTVLNTNNFYSFGMGLSFLSLLNGMNWGLQKQLGIENEFVYNALFSILFEYYIFIAETIDKPLPGKKMGIDVFYYSRLVSAALMSHGMDIAISFLHDEKRQTNLQAVYEFLKKFPPVKLASRALMPDKESIQLTFYRKRSVKLFLEMHLESIQKTVKTVIEMRKSDTYRRINFISSYIPILSEDTKQVLSFLLEKKLEPAIQALDRLLVESSVQLQQHAVIFQSLSEKLRKLPILDQEIKEDYIAKEPKKMTSDPEHVHKLSILRRPPKAVSENEKTRDDTTVNNKKLSLFQH